MLNINYYMNKFIYLIKIYNKKKKNNFIIIIVRNYI